MTPYVSKKQREAQLRASRHEARRNTQLPPTDQSIRTNQPNQVSMPDTGHRAPAPRSTGPPLQPKSNERLVDRPSSSAVNPVMMEGEEKQHVTAVTYNRKNGFIYLATLLLCALCSIAISIYWYTDFSPQQNFIREGLNNHIRRGRAEMEYAVKLIAECPTASLRTATTTAGAATILSNWDYAIAAETGFEDEHLGRLIDAILLSNHTRISTHMRHMTRKIREKSDMATALVDQFDGWYHTLNTTCRQIEQDLKSASSRRTWIIYNPLGRPEIGAAKRYKDEQRNWAECSRLVADAVQVLSYTVHKEIKVARHEWVSLARNWDEQERATDWEQILKNGVDRAVTKVVDLIFDFANPEQLPRPRIRRCLQPPYQHAVPLPIQRTVPVV